MAEGEFGGSGVRELGGAVLALFGALGWVWNRGSESISGAWEEYQRNKEIENTVPVAQPGLQDDLHDLERNFNLPDQPPPKKRFSPAPGLRPTPGRQADPVKFPDFTPNYQPTYVADPPPVPVDMPQRRLNPSVDATPGAPPAVTTPQDRPVPTSTVKTSIPDIQFPEFVPPVMSKESIIHKVCVWVHDPAELDAIQESATIRHMAGRHGLVEQGREDYQLEDRMALVFSSAEDTDTTAKINTQVIYGLDSINKLLHSPVVAAKSAKFPIQVSIPPGVVYRTCNKTVVTQPRGTPTKPTDDNPCCPPADKSECADTVINECFVPVRNFKNNDPDGVGYNTQLQLLFTDDDGNIAKRITVPNPKDEVTAELINLLLEPHLEQKGIYFGHVKCEVDMSPYGYIRYFAFDEDEGKSLIYSLADLSKGAIVPNSFRFSKRNRDIAVGLHLPYKAISFEFLHDGSEPRCQTFWLQSKAV
jgi:hypothetical protein